MTVNTKPNWKAALMGKCPSCGKGNPFSGLIRLNSACPQCGKDYGKYKTDDGPAFVAISLVGTLVGILAGIVEVVYEPRIWVHIALWLPFIIIFSLITIRLTKTTMIAHQMKLET